MKTLDEDCCNLPAAHHHILNRTTPIKFKYNKQVHTINKFLAFKYSPISGNMVFSSLQTEKLRKRSGPFHCRTTTLRGTAVSRCWVCDPALSLCDLQCTCWLIWFYLESYLLVSNGTQNNKHYYMRIFSLRELYLVLS